MYQLLLLFYACLLAAPGVLAQNNARDSQPCGMGTLLDTQEIKRQVATYQTQTATEHKKKNGDKQYTVSSTPGEEERKTYRVTVRLNDMVYTAESNGNIPFGYNPTRLVVNDPVQTCVQGKKLVLMRPDGKQYKANIVQTVREANTAASQQGKTEPGSEPKQATIKRSSVTSLQVTSNPTGADIEVDGAFVGNTPSKIELAHGEHSVTVSKSGFKTYSRKVRLSGGEISLNAELEH